MGGCFSSSSSGADSVTNSALIISPKGELRPFSTPIFVSDVLRSETQPASFFLCNSDNLYYDEHITPLDPDHELDAGQIYFVLPISKLRDRLTASEMAALAVKASVALNAKPKTESTSKAQIKRKNQSKISPFVVMETSNINVIVDEEARNKRLYETNHNRKQQQQTSGLRVSRSGSIRKMQRYSSRKARLAVRSFRLRLSTIYEGESTDLSQKSILVN